MSVLNIQPGKYWQVKTVVFSHPPIATMAEAAFYAPECHHTISWTIYGENKIEALHGLHIRLVMYGLHEVAELVTRELAKEEEKV